MSSRDEASASPPRADAPTFEAFFEEIRDLARSLDPQLARALGDGEPVPPSRPWAGDRLRGLTLCLSMLRYARDEVAQSRDDAARIDDAMARVLQEIALLEAGARNGG